MTAAEEFSSWVAPHLPVMTRVAARLAPAADRDDIVQDALARAWRKRSTYDAARGTAAAWLCAIVAGEARRSARRLRSAGVLIDRATDASPQERDLDLERAVAALPPRQREAVDLHYFADLSVSETATVMGCAEGTVKSTLYDARQRLRVLLGEDS